MEFIKKGKMMSKNLHDDIILLFITLMLVLILLLYKPQGIFEYSYQERQQNYEILRQGDEVLKAFKIIKRNAVRDAECFEEGTALIIMQQQERNGD